MAIYSFGFIIHQRRLRKVLEIP